MAVVYDTDRVPARDRYEHFRTGCGNELAPVAAHGRPPGRLSAMMTVARADGFELAKYAWTGDSPVESRRTERLIRECDPECYRMYLVVSGVLRVEQADNRAELRSGDLALYDLSRPFLGIDGVERGAMRGVMLSFPRSWLPVASDQVRSVIGTVLPRSLPGHNPAVQLLIELVRAAELTTDSDQGALFREWTAGLIGQRLGRSAGVSPRTCHAMHLMRIRSIIHRLHSDPWLNLDRIASAAHMSRRYVLRLFEDTDDTPMRLVKEIRLQECRRSLEDPANDSTPIGDIMTAHGYRRPDQFARDFTQRFGSSPTQARDLATRRRSTPPTASRCV